MKLRDIVQSVDGEVMCGHNHLDKEVECAFASDLMSDVLTLKHCNFILITGLCNLQSVRTAEMSDISAILYVRNKIIDPEMIALAEDNDMIIIRTPYSMFKTAGCLYAAGLKPIY
jgi:predicted transcriptional regulator